MDWRDLLDLADRRGWLHHVRSEVDPYLEMARVINALNEELVLFEHPLGSRFMVSAGACSQRCYLAAGMSWKRPTCRRLCTRHSPTRALQRSSVKQPVRKRRSRAPT